MYTPRCWRGGLVSGEQRPESTTVRPAERWGRDGAGEFQSRLSARLAGSACRLAGLAECDARHDQFERLFARSLPLHFTIAGISASLEAGGAHGTDGREASRRRWQLLGVVAVVLGPPGCGAGRRRTGICTAICGKARKCVVVVAALCRPGRRAPAVLCCCTRPGSGGHRLRARRFYECRNALVGSMFPRKG